jgi:hypothetical protein
LYFLGCVCVHGYEHAKLKLLVPTSILAPTPKWLRAPTVGGKWTWKSVAMPRGGANSVYTVGSLFPR